MQGQPVILSLKGDCAELPRLIEELRGIGEGLGMTGRTLNQVEVALEEHFSNIVFHGCGDGAEHSIQVSLSVDNGVLTMEIVDDGIAHNPLENPLPDRNAPLEQRKTGQLGVLLMRKLMDECHYARQGDRNVLTMKKRVR
jgi:anti-sigma regulatory factor (Ser/Thr protein kinase)